MQPTANASKEEDDHDLAVPYTLYQTPKREQWRSQDIPSVLKSDQCNRSFLIRMVAATALLATFVVMTGPLQQKALIVQLTSSQPRYNETSGWWNESFLNESLPREPSSPKESSNDALSSNKVTMPVDDNNQLSEAAWKGFLKRFRMAMQTQSYEVWLPVVVRGSKVYVAQQHLTRVQKERGRRFKLFTAMMSHALNVTSSILQSSNVDKVRRKKVLPLLDETWRDRPIPLLMALGDQRRCEGKKFPRFGWSRLEDKECTMFALPSFNVYRDAPEDSPDYDLFHKNLEQLYPWSKKKPQAVWRGSATGRISNDWTDLPRAQLVNVSIYHPSLLDAGFVHAKQFKNMYPKQEAQLHQNSRFAKWIDFKDFQKYRAVVDIDGNSWSDRFGNLLCLNSAVVKVQPSNENYFFRELEPWVHYIPVSSNMSDILEALRFAVFNRTSRKVRSVVFRANEWCRTRLTKSSMATDVFQTLNSYLELLGNDPTRWRQWEDLFEVYQSNMTLVESPVSGAAPTAQ